MGQCCSEREESKAGHPRHRRDGKNFRHRIGFIGQCVGQSALFDSSEEVQMEWHRALQLVLIRRGLPSSETQDKLIAQLESLYDESWKSAAGSTTTGQTPSQRKGAASNERGIDGDTSNSILQFPGYALNLEPTHFQRELITELIHLGSKKVVTRLWLR